MFFRFLKDGRRKPIDVYDLYDGELVLVGGGPEFTEKQANAIEDSEIPVMAMNNAGVKVRHDFWVCADRANCYVPALVTGKALKFARLAYSEDDHHGVRWRQIPGTLFYGCNSEAGMNDFLQRHVQLAWHWNVFTVALQIAWRLGFRKIYTVGCGFNISKDRQYSYPTDLSDDQVNYNQRTYDMVLGHLVKGKACMERQGLEIVSCTPGSKLGGMFSESDIVEVCNRYSGRRGHASTLDVLHCSTKRE